MVKSARNYNENNIHIIFLVYWSVLVIWQNVNLTTERSGFSMIIKLFLIGMLSVYCLLHAKYISRNIILWVKIAGEYMLKMDLELKKSKQKGDVLFVRLKGNLTKGGIAKIYHYLIPVIKHHRIPNLIINFKDVNKIDELGVDSILKIKCLSKGISKIYLCSLKDYHEKILKRLHLKVYPKEKAIKKELMV